MAVTVTELIEMRDALLRARAKGVRVAQISGERIEFATDAEMAAAINDLEARITRASTPSRARAVRFTSSKGF